MIQNTPDRAKFDAVLKSWAGGFRWVVRRYFALSTESGVYFRYGFLCFTNENVPNVLQNFSVETENVIVGQEFDPVRPEYDFPDLRSIVEGQPEFVCQSRKLKIAQNNTSLSQSFFPVQHPQFPAAPRAPGLRISVGGSQVLPRPRLEGLDLQVRSLEQPFIDMRELLATVSVPTDLLDPGALPFIDVVAFPPLNISRDSSVEQRTANITIKMSVGLDPSRCGVSLKSFDNNVLKPLTSIAGSEINWVNAEDDILGTTEHGLVDDNYVQVFLRYDGEYVDHLWLRPRNKTLNPFFDMHKTFDSDQRLRDIIFSGNQRDFEGGIALLLQLLGLSVLRYGDLSGLQDAPDLIGYSTGGHVYVMECTIGDPDHKGKLLKLYDRTKKIREYLSSSITPFTSVQAVLFSTLPRASTHEHWKTLTSYKIALVCKEEIENLWVRIETPPNAEEIYRAALNAIPPSQTDSSQSDLL